MAAYPPGPSRLAVLPDYGANSAPADLLYIVSAAVGLNAGDASDRFITPNNFLETITRNITQKTLIFEDADGVRTVSAANTGKLDYSAVNQSFQVSENGGAYQNLVKGVGANTRVAYWTATDTLSSDGAFLWDETNDRLLVNVSVAGGVAPIDVLADGASIAQQWRENGGTGRVQMQMGSGFGQLGTTVADDFALMTNSLQRVNVEATGAVVVGSIIPATGQLMVNAATAITTALVVNNAAASSVDIALYQVNGSNRARLTENSEWILGLASTISGKLTMANSAGVTLTSWSAGNAASSLNFIWPVIDPTVNQVLRASAPVAGNVTLSWATVVTAPAAPVGSVQFNGGGVFDGDANLLWDDTAKQLLIGGIALGSGEAPIDVIADALASAQQWRENAGAAKVLMQVPSSFGQLGTVGAHDFALVTNSLQRLNIESGGAAVFGSIVPATAQVMINALTVNTVGLVVNNAAATNVDLAQFQINSSNRFQFTKDAEMIAGLASTVDGKLTLASAGAAFTQSLMAGTAPAATNSFRWPNADPTAGQALTASAPVAGVVTLSWTTVGGATINPTNGVMPVRTSATTFGDSKISLAINSTIVTAADAAAFVVGANGATNPTLLVVTNVASAETGLRITGNAAGSGVTLTALSSGSNETIFLFPRGTGRVTIGDQTASQNPILFISGPSTSSNAAVQIQASAAGNGQLHIRRGDGNLTSAAVSTGAYHFFNAAGAQPLSLVMPVDSVLRVSNGSTGIGSVLIGTSTDSVTGNFTVMSSNAATNSIVTVARLGVNSTGTAADGFGAALSFSAESSTTNDTEMARINAFWTTASHAIRASALSFSVVTGGTVTEAARLAVAGLDSPFTLSVYDGTAPNIWTAGAFAAKLYLISPTLPAVGVAAHFSATAIDAPQWQMLRGRGTNASPTAIQASDSIGNIEWWGQTSTSTNNVVAGARIRVSATENWSAGNNGCQMIFFTSNNAGTITDRMYLKETGTLRIGATSGSYDTTNLLQIGNYGSFATGIVASIYSGANGTKGLQVIGTNGQTANLLEIFRDALTPNLLTLAASGLLSLRAGLNISTIVANVGGTLAVNTTSEANVSTGETDLMTYTVVANTAGTNGDRLVFTCSGSFITSVNNKQLRAYLGSTLLFDTGALAFAPAADVDWKLTVIIYRTGSATQGSVAEFAAGGAVLTSNVQQGGGTEDFTTNLVFKLTGQAGASDEIFQDLMISEWHPAGS